MGAAMLTFVRSRLKRSINRGPRHARHRRRLPMCTISAGRFRVRRRRSGTGRELKIASALLTKGIIASPRLAV